MFEKPMNQDLSSNDYGNRVHNRNNEPMETRGFTQSTYVNPRNNLEKSMEGMGKDSDRTVRRRYKDA